MSVIRQQNWLGQQRIDVPHLRSMESSICADFDVLAGRTMAGGQPLVVRGFTLTNTDAGTTASAVQLSTADSILVNLNATESGSMYWVPSDRAVETLNSATNARVDGAFTPSQVNYVGLDLERSADDNTTDLVQFLDANTLLESPRNVPLARTLDYRIVISTTPFSASPNIIPIARITTNSQNQVSSVDDARNLMWRLGSGGDFPNRYNSFTWPGDRVEQDPNVSGLDTLEKFTGGDKDIRSLKDWMDAMMSRVWEIGGGQNWYSPTTPLNVKLVGAPSPAVFSGGDNFEWGIEAGVPATGLYSSDHLHWQGLSIVFENANPAGVYYNTIVDQISDDAAGDAASSKTALAVGDCIYVDIDRTSNATITAQKASLQSLGTPAIPGSRIIIAWRDANGVYRRDSQHPINTSYPAATTAANGSVRLAYAAGTPANPTVVPLDANNRLVLGAAPYATVGANDTLVITGGASAYGIRVIGNSAGGSGIRAEGVGTSSAINAYTDAANVSVGVAAINGIAQGANHRGVWGTGTGSQPGIYGEGPTVSIWGASTLTGNGILGTNSGTGVAVKGTNSGTGLAAEFASSGAAVDAVKVTTGIFLTKSIESFGATNLSIGLDNAKTGVVLIGNAGNGVTMIGNSGVLSGNFRVENTQDLGYVTARSFKKVLGAWACNVITGTGSPTPQYTAASGPGLGKAITGGGTDSITVYGQFSLPLGAVITAATVKVSHPSGGSASAAMTVNITKGTVAASGTEWTSANVISGGSYALPLGGVAATGVDFPLTMTATAADRTVGADNSVFNVVWTGTGTGSQYFISLTVTYEITNLTPDIG